MKYDLWDYPSINPIHANCLKKERRRKSGKGGKKRKKKQAVEKKMAVQTFSKGFVL